MIEVKPLTDADVHRFYKGKVRFSSPVIGYAARKGLLTIGIGGFWQEIDGRVWGFIAFKPGYRKNILYRYMLRCLAEAEQSGVPEIYIVRDHDLDTSARFLSRGGFVKTEEKAADYEVWVWKNPRIEE